MTLELLVDSGEFWSRLVQDLGTARKYVYAEALSFEGDAAGRGMAEALLTCPAPDRRLMIDSFTRHVVSDRLVWAPHNLLDRGLRREVRDTRRMIAGLRSGGVSVRFTNPPGPWLTQLPRRNHKKLVVLDDRIAYIGGINFSDHNFAWHDLMLRIEHPAAAAFLREDFEHSWQGRHQAGRRAFPGMVLNVLDGVTNDDAFASLLELVDRARESVFVECPYLTSPVYERLAAARRRGVAVTAVTPERNNWGLARDAMLRLASRHDVDVRFYPDRMTHMKALLVDGRRLVLGSANFDVWSYRFQQEFMAVVSDPQIIRAFRSRVLEPDLQQSAPCAAALAAGAGRGVELKLAALDGLSALWKAALDTAPGSLSRVPDPAAWRAVGAAAGGA